MSITIRSRAAALVILLAFGGCSGNPQKQWTAPPCLAAQPAANSGRSYEQCGLHEVDTATIGLRDNARHRTIEATLYIPATGDGPFPLIVFSHGLANSHRGYRYLGRHWASHGYIVAHLNHEGSDLKVLEERGVVPLLLSLFDRKHWRDRAKDVSFAITELSRGQVVTQVAQLGKGDAAPPRLEGRVDLTRVGVAGHSYGAFTALEIIGLRLGTKAPDPRVRAAVIISAPRLRKLVDEKDFARISVPAMHLTGTRDESRLFYTYLRHRRYPFDKMGASDQYLVVLDGADHSTFSDDPPELDPRHPARVRAIQAATTAFWDAYLKGDANAKRWLRDGGINGQLGSLGLVEIK